MVTKASETTTSTSVLVWTRDEIIALLKADAEAAGYAWPDMGEGEGDQIYIALDTANGVKAEIDQGALFDAATLVVGLTDKEASA